MYYSEMFQEFSGDAADGLMDGNWWAKFGIEEAMLDNPETCMMEMPAHDRLAGLMVLKDNRSNTNA